MPVRHSCQLLSSAALVVMLAVSTATVDAHPEPPGPTLEIANPESGALLTPGRMVISGVAYDDNAEDGIGVDRVSIFLGERDEGGLFLGNATLGMHNPQSVEGGDPQFADAGWRFLTPPLKGAGKSALLSFYARSSVNGAETIEHIRVVLGEDNGGESDEEGGGDE